MDAVGAWLQHISANRLEESAALAYQAFSYRTPEGGLRALYAHLMLAGKQMTEMVCADSASVAGHSVIGAGRHMPLGQGCRMCSPRIRAIGGLWHTVSI